MKNSRFLITANDLTWIEIDRATLLNNIKNLSRLIGPKVQIALAAKANAYGHGLQEIVTALKNGPAPYLALHSTSEAELARRAGWSGKIMLVGGVADSDIEAVIRLDLEPTIFETGSIDVLGRLSRRSSVKTRVHLKLETGTHRQGIVWCAPGSRGRPSERIPEPSCVNTPGTRRRRR